jgi:hypothetical protein
MQVRGKNQAYRSYYLGKGLGVYSVALPQEFHRKTLVNIKVTHHNYCKDIIIRQFLHIEN